MAKLNLLDLAKLRGNDAEIGLIEENLTYAPEMDVFPVRTIRGTSYKTLIRNGLPSVSFRGANEGVTPSKSNFKDALIAAYIIDAQIKADKAVADANEDGPEAWKAIEASGVMKATLLKLGAQIFYGTSTDAKGFPGLKAALAKSALTTAGDALTVDATGTTASTASSVYAVKFGPQDATLIFGQGMGLQLGDWRIQSVADDNDATKQLTAYVNGLTGWAGLQIGNENCARRILNLTTDANKGLTDSLLADLIATFPIGFRPDAIFMSRRSRKQLQKSRTVTLQGNGKDRPSQPNIAPVPTEYDGVPIVATDSIKDTDAIE